jgi:hypothetical protein
MMQKFDAERTISFLETQNESILPLYEKFGYEISKEGKIHEANLPHWGMIRYPK